MEDMKVGIILLAMIVLSMANSTLSKAAMDKGMSSYVFTTYTHGIAAVFFLLPIALFRHRKLPLPSMGCSLLLRLFLLGAINCGCYILLYNGVLCSSPTLASALINLSPAFTFILAIIFRMEALNLRTQITLLKSIGTFVVFGGALIATFYQGLPITIFPSPTNSSLLSLEENQQNWVVGALLLATSGLFLSFSFIIKTWIANDFPSEVLIGLISCIFETIVAAIITFIAENDSSNVWTPSIRIQWISILLGAIDAGILNTVGTWACRVKGPLFVAMFMPLHMIVAVIMGVSFLGDVLHVGSVIGGVIIALGFYTVMKGKAKEELLLKVVQEESCPNKVPLLRSESVQDV